MFASSCAGCMREMKFRFRLAAAGSGFTFECQLMFKADIGRAPRGVSGLTFEVDVGRLTFSNHFLPRRAGGSRTRRGSSVVRGRCPKENLSPQRSQRSTWWRQTGGERLLSRVSSDGGGTASACTQQTYLPDTADSMSATLRGEAPRPSICSTAAAYGTNIN